MVSDGTYITKIKFRMIRHDNWSKKFCANIAHICLPLARKSNFCASNYNFLAMPTFVDFI